MTEFSAAPLPRASKGVGKEEGGGRITIMETTAILLSKDLPFRELESSEQALQDSL